MVPHRRRYALDLKFAQIVEYKITGDQRGRIRRQKTGIGLRQTFHPLRQTHRMTLRGVVHPQIVANRTNDDVTRVKPHASGEPKAMLALHFGGIAGDFIAQIERRITGALRMILMRNRRAEQRHDAIAGVLVDRAFEAVHTLAQDREEAIEDAMPLFRVELLGQFHRALHIGEQHRDLLALAFKCGLRLQNFVGEVFGGVIRDAAGCPLARRRRACRSRAAFRAELSRSIKDGIAGGTGPDELGSAFLAEFRAEFVVVLTGGAFHSAILCALTLGANLRTVRLRRNLTIRDVADKIGTGPRAVANMEKGKSSGIVVDVALF